MNRKERRSQSKSGTAPAMTQDEAQNLLRQALSHHQAGRPREAGPLYDRVLAAYPNQADALHFSGILLAQIGRPADGAKRLARAVQIAPDHGEFHANYGQALASLGRTEDAEKALRRAIELQADLHDAHNNLGNLLKAKGDLTSAEAAYRTAIEIQPKFAGAWNNLGNLLGDARRHEEALEALQTAAGLAPSFAGVHSNLGAQLFRQGDKTAAEISLRRAIELAPTLREAHEYLGVLCLEDDRHDEAAAHFETALANGSRDPAVSLNLANALRHLARLQEAEQQIRKVLADSPDHADALRILGLVLREQNRLSEAEDALTRARSLNPEDAETLNGLGWVLDGQGRLSEATTLYEEALARRADYPTALNNLGVCYLNQGRIDDAEDAFLQALDLEPEKASTASNLLLTANYRADPPADIFARHQALASTGRETETFDFSNHDRTPDRRLQIGFVSGDFRRHSVAFFFAPLLEQLDAEKFETTCYANVTRSDNVTARLRELANSWVDAVGMSDDRLVERIRADKIDILIDLSGHTRGNRLGVFAQRAAPVQATWLGYPNTTAVDGMDYRLTDAIADPAGESEALHSESLIHLPDGFLCYQAPADAPEVTALPCAARGTITFGSFNNWSKVSTQTIEAWSDVLHAVADSRLYLKARALADPGTRTKCLEHFHTRGITADRLEIAGWHADPADHLAAYSRCDIALDTWPYSGTTTTCEALWMGVPVITRTGDRHASRVSASLLHQVGLDELVARDVAGFVEVAKNLAANTERLQDLRQTLRGRMQTSSLGDAAAFARQFETALRGMWAQSA